MASYGVEEIERVLTVAMADVLGEYAYTDSNDVATTTPAIYTVQNFDSDPPSIYATSGLECLIFPPNPASTTYLGKQVRLEANWEIRLIQHDRDGDLMAGCAAILAVYPSSRLGAIVPKGIDRDLQVNITLSNARYYG